MQKDYFVYFWVMERKIKYKPAYTMVMGETLVPLILDKIDDMRKIDKENMISYCTQRQVTIVVSKKCRKINLPYSGPKNIIIAGMGGSAIGENS